MAFCARGLRQHHPGTGKQRRCDRHQQQYRSPSHLIFSFSVFAVVVTYFPLARPLRGLRGGGQPCSLTAPSWQTLHSRLTHDPLRSFSSEEPFVGVGVPPIPGLAGFAARTMAPLVVESVRWVSYFARFGLSAKLPLSPKRPSAQPARDAPCGPPADVLRDAVSAPLQPLLTVMGAPRVDM